MTFSNSRRPDAVRNTPTCSPLGKSRRRLGRLTCPLSNPDFILTRLPEGNDGLKFKPGRARAEALVARFRDETFFGKLDPSLLVCNLAVKTHNRPDWRYQHLHEGNVLKAISHALGIILRYVVVTTESKREDDSVFASSSIVSVVNGDDAVSRAIDEVWTVTRFEDIRGQIAGLLSNWSSKAGT